MIEKINVIGKFIATEYHYVLDKFRVNEVNNVI